MRRALVIMLVSVAFLSGCGALSHSLTASAFTKRVAQRLEAAAPGTGVKVVKALNLRLPGRSNDISLQSLYNAYQGGSDPDLIIASFVTYLTQARPPIPLNWAEAKGHIVPLLVGRELPPAGPGGLVTLEWDAGLKVVLAMEGSRGFVYLSPADLEHWHVTPDEAYQVALGNLRERTTTEPMRRARVSDIKGLYLYLWQAKDGLDASRLLLVSEWRKRLLAYIDWDLVVVIPSREELIAFDGGHQDWVKALKDYAHQQYTSAANPISDQLYTFHDGHLTLYKP